MAIREKLEHINALAKETEDELLSYPHTTEGEMCNDTIDLLLTDNERERQMDINNAIYFALKAKEITKSEGDQLWLEYM